MDRSKAVTTEFAKSTSIHGIYYIFQPKFSKCNRCAWLIFFLLCLSVCLYECSLNVQEYLKMEVQTTVVYQPVNNEFPSITLCSQYQYKRSVIGNVSFSNYIVAQNIAVNQTYFKRLANENKKTCKSEHESNLSKMILKYGVDYFYQKSSRMKKFLELFLPVFPNFQSDVEKCWIDNKQIDCAHVLVNRPTDDGFCYTFNMGSELLKSFGVDSDFYERMSKEIKHKKVVRFLLKTNQSDNCESTVIKRGVGYYAVINEKDSTSIMMYDTPIYLAPGYINEVIIKPIHYKRNTESMGLCTNKSNVNLANSTKYMQSWCYFECAMRTVLQQCQCYPLNQIRFHDWFLKNAKHRKILTGWVKMCNVSGLYCARTVQQMYIRSAISKKCSECVAQCDEYRYNYRLSMLAMLHDQLKKIVSKDIVEKIDKQDLLKNFVDVLFKFENNYVESVREDQRVTISDLFNNLGNNIGLFLGMSFMSNFEVLISVFINLLMMQLNKTKKTVEMFLKSRKAISTRRRSSAVQLALRRKHQRTVQSIMLSSSTQTEFKSDQSRNGDCFQR